MWDECVEDGSKNQKEFALLLQDRLPDESLIPSPFIAKFIESVVDLKVPIRLELEEESIVKTKDEALNIPLI